MVAGLNLVIPANRGDIEYICKHLSAQNLAEQKAVGWTDYDLLRRITGLLDKGPSEACYEDGNPLYVFGIADGFTWFLCTDAAFAKGTAGIRYGRKRVAAVRAAEGRPLICVSRSPHPDAARWFRALGFVEKPMRSVDGSRCFVYE